ncbi:MAG: hypothetical protein IPJ69_14215 [Deltaproteobacteria bacterium]|nr:MAG: hypothetical protein IPJ69_14215 [Deltaproteobacteria bacterium]
MVMEARIQSGRGVNKKDTHVVIMGRSGSSVDRRVTGDLRIAASFDENVTSTSLLQPGRSQYTECPIAEVTLLRMLSSASLPFTPRCFASPYTRGISVPRAPVSQSAPVRLNTGYTFTPQSQGSVLARFTEFPTRLPDALTMIVELVFISASTSPRRGPSNQSLSQTFSRAHPELRVPEAVRPGTYEVHIENDALGINSIIQSFQVTPDIQITGLQSLRNAPNGYISYEFTSTNEGRGDLSLWHQSELIHITRGLNRILIPLDGRDASQVNFSLSIDGREYRVQ